MSQHIAPFQANKPREWESYSTVSHNDPASVYISAADSAVRFAWNTGDLSASIRVTPQAARRIAAELIAAADSTETAAALAA